MARIHQILDSDEDYESQSEVGELEADEDALEVADNVASEAEDDEYDDIDNEFGIDTTRPPNARNIKLIRHQITRRLTLLRRRKKDTQRLTAELCAWVRIVRAHNQ